MEMTEPVLDSTVGLEKSRRPVPASAPQAAFRRILLKIFFTPRGLGLICICVAVIVIWPGRNRIITDGLSYLDMASQASNGDLAALGNRYWSPAYPALIGVALFLLHPSAANEVPVIQLVDFIVFVFTVWSFSLFYRFWSRSLEEIEEPNSTDKGLFTLFAFACFLRFTSTSIELTLTSPDMLVAAMVFLVAAMGFRISRPGAGWKQFAGLGALLGVGIYVKAALFPLSYAFIVLFFLSLALSWEFPRRRQLAYLAVTTATCTLVAMPLIVFMSVQEGKFTTGEVAKLNYLWTVDGLRPAHTGWTGGTAPEYGTPLHPPRKLMENPTVLEFATPIAATYPLWYSPAYWYAGAKPAFNLRKQVLAVEDGLNIYRVIAIHYIGFIAGAILLLVLGMGKVRRTLPWRVSFWLLAWPLAACAMYALVRPFERYQAAFLLLLCLQVYRALAFRVERRIAIGVCSIALLVAMAPVAHSVAKSMGTTVKELRNPSDADYVAVGKKLQLLGLRPGDKVAIAGPALSCFFVRYDRFRIVSQIADSDDFLQLNPADAKRVEDRLAFIGVKALIAIKVPHEASREHPENDRGNGWTDVGFANGTQVSALMLQPAEEPSH